MFIRWLIAFLLVPVTVFIAFPFALEYSFGAGCPQIVPPFSVNFISGLMLAAVGVFFMIASVGLFIKHGKGTALPWDPPTVFVARGIYLYVRNPMVIGALLFLFAEALLLASWPIFYLTVLGLVAKLFYIPLCEEKTLEKRFGDSYQTYKKNVPRWIPRRTPYKAKRS